MEFGWTDITHLKVRGSSRVDLGGEDGALRLVQREVTKTGGVTCTGCACPSPWTVERRWQLSGAGCLIFQGNR